MTYHIRTPDYVCKNCDAVFIAYEKDLPCPKCSTPEQSNGESYNFIDELIHSMKVHKTEFGFYMPPAWIPTRYADYIQSMVYKSFDFAEKEPDKGVEYILKALRILNPNIDRSRCKHLEMIMSQVAIRSNKLK